MRLHIYSLSQTLHEGDAESVSLPTESGEIAVLNQHIPLVTTLKLGKIVVRNKTEENEINVHGGVAYTDGKELVVLAD